MYSKAKGLLLKMLDNVLEYIYSNRAWQRKIYSLIKKKKHQAEVYACLSMLISEQDESCFLHNQATFLTYWQDREPEFIAYDRQEYLSRASKQL